MITVVWFYFISCFEIHDYVIYVLESQNNVSFSLSLIGPKRICSSDRPAFRWSTRMTSVFQLDLCSYPIHLFWVFEFLNIDNITLLSHFLVWHTGIFEPPQYRSRYILLRCSKHLLYSCVIGVTFYSIRYEGLTWYESHIASDYQINVLNKVKINNDKKLFFGTGYYRYSC